MNSKRKGDENSEIWVPMHGLWGDVASSGAVANGVGLGDVKWSDEAAWIVGC